MCVDYRYVAYLYQLTEAELKHERKSVIEEIDAGHTHRGMYHSIMFIDIALERIASGEYVPGHPDQSTDEWVRSCQVMDLGDWRPRPLMLENLGRPHAKL